MSRIDVEMWKLHTYYVELCEVANTWRKTAGMSTWVNRNG